jgi:hypothetical protein
MRCGVGSKVNEACLGDCWFRALCGSGRAPDGLHMYEVATSAPRRADPQRPFSVPAALRCWADPARSILIQLRALAPGWTGWRRE